MYKSEGKGFNSVNQRKKLKYYNEKEKKKDIHQGRWMLLRGGGEIDEIGCFISFCSFMCFVMVYRVVCVCCDIGKL